MDSRAFSAEPRWQRWGRNLLLVMGLSSASGFVLMLLTIVESQFMPNHIFTGTEGGIVMHALLTLPALLTAVLVGFVAPYFLTFRYAAWALLVVGAIWAISLYSSVQHFVEPEQWQVAIELGQAILVPILLVVTFVGRRRRLRGARKA